MNGKAMEIVRAIVRPLVTLGGFGVLCWLVVDGRLSAQEFLALVGPIVGFWFATRQNGDSA